MTRATTREVARWRGDEALLGRGAGAVLATGLAALGFAWLGPLPGLARQSFAAHMTLHVLVVAVASGWIALGLAGTRLDPVRRAPALFAAIPASFVELAVVWVWHAPGPHHWARETAGGLVLEQATFLATGLLLWLSAFGGDAERRTARAGAGVVGLLLTAMHMTLLGALLGLAPRVLYDHGHGHGAPGGMTALEDQHVGGAVMLLVGGAAYLAGGLWLGARLVRDGRRGTTALGGGGGAR